MAIPLLTPEERERIAGLVGIKPDYLYLISTGRQCPSPAVARALHDTDPRFTLQELRPEDWHRIWPELAEAR